MAQLVLAAGLEGFVAVDSAGTGAYHAGEPPDRRSADAAQTRGVTLQGAARQFEATDFERFDHVVAMDTENLSALEALSENDVHRSKLTLLRDFDATCLPGSDVPDPYYGGEGGFDAVFEICEAACRGLLVQLRERHRLP